jgi:hypothetical protein
MYNDGFKAVNTVEEASGLTDIKHSEIESKIPYAAALIQGLTTVSICGLNDSGGTGSCNNEYFELKILNRKFLIE